MTQEELFETNERELVSPRQFARFLGVSKRAVNDAINTKRLNRSVKSEANGYNRLDVAQAVLEWFDNANLAQDRNNHGRNKEEEGKISYREAQRMREEYRAKITKLEYEEKQGSLLPKESFHKAISNRARIFRDKIMAIPQTIGPRLAHQEGSAITILLQSELEKAFVLLTDGGESVG